MWDRGEGSFPWTCWLHSCYCSLGCSWPCSPPLQLLHQDLQGLFCKGVFWLVSLSLPALCWGVDCNLTLAGLALSSVFSGLVCLVLINFIKMKLSQDLDLLRVSPEGMHLHLRVRDSRSGPLARCWRLLAAGHPCLWSKDVLQQVDARKRSCVKCSVIHQNTGNRCVGLEIEAI